MHNTAFYCNLIAIFVMIFCQANMFAFLITPKFSRRKTVWIMNIVCAVCYAAFAAEQFAFGMNVTAQYMLFTLTVPSLAVNLVVSKYYGARFWFTFFFCDGTIANASLAAWLIGQFTPLRGPGYGHVMLRCVMMIALTVFLIFYLKEKFQELLAAQYEDRIERSRENYASMMNRIDSVREMKHDMLHHIRTAEGYLEEGRQQDVLIIRQASMGR